MLDRLVALFKQPTVLDMLKERPKLVASVNHYAAKNKGLEEQIEEGKKAKDKAKGAKAAEAAAAKLESNRAKYDAEVEKLKHLTHQLTSSFHQIEATVVVDAAGAAASASAIKAELARHVGSSAKEIVAHLLVSGDGGGGRGSIGGGRRARRRGKATGNEGGGGGRKASTYDPNGPSRKALLRSGLGANGKPLKLAELRYEQAVTLQAACRRLVRRVKYRRMRRAAVRIQALRRGFSAFRKFYYIVVWVKRHQGLARGRAVRREVTRMQRAAVLVQRAYGGFRIKAKFKHAVHQVIKLQSIGRGHVARGRKRVMAGAATRVEKCFRARLGRARAAARRAAVLRLQAAARRKRVYAGLASQRAAASSIQALVRRRAAKARYGSDRKSVQVLQGFGRIVLAKRRLQRLHVGARGFQATWRGLCARRLLEAARASAAKVQALARGVLLRHGAASRVVLVRHFKLVWPDLLLPPGCDSSDATRLRSSAASGGGASSLGSPNYRRKGSMEDLFGSADDRASGTSAMSNPMMSNPLMRKGGGGGAAAAAKATPGKLGGGAGTGGGGPVRRWKVHEQLMLFDDALLRLVSVRSFLSMVASRRRLFGRHKAAAVLQAQVRSKIGQADHGLRLEAAVVLQAGARRLVYRARFCRLRGACVALQKFRRSRKEAGDALDALARKAREVAYTARQAKQARQAAAAKCVQRFWTRRRYLKRFRRAVADFLVKRERRKRESRMDKEGRVSGASTRLSAWARGCLSRFTSDARHCPPHRKLPFSERPSTVPKALDPAPAASAASPHVKRSKESAAAREGPRFCKGGLKPAPRLHGGPSKKRPAARGRFAHFRSAAVVLQAFARRVAALHRLFSRGTVTASLAWRKAPAAGSAAGRPLPVARGKAGGSKPPPTARRVNAHKLPWYRGHRGTVKVSGAAIRQIGLLGFCRLIAVRRRLYRSECAACCAQALVRGWLGRRRFLRALSQVVRVQTVFRGHRGKKTSLVRKATLSNFQQVAARRKRRRLFRGLVTCVGRLLGMKRRAKALVAARRLAKAKRTLARLCRARGAGRKLIKGLHRWRRAREALVKLQALVRRRRCRAAFRTRIKAAQRVASWGQRRLRAARMRQAVLLIVRMAKAGGGSLSSGGAKEWQAAYRLQRWWRRRVKREVIVAGKVHKRVLKAGLRYKALAVKLKKSSDKALEDKKELELELRVTRKHQEESIRASQERQEKMMAQQMEAMQAMQARGAGPSADTAGLQAQMEAMVAQMARASQEGMGSPGGGGGGGGEDTRRLLMKIEKTEDALDEVRRKLDVAERESDDHRKEANKANNKLSRVSDELFDVKKRCVEKMPMPRPGFWVVAQLEYFERPAVPQPPVCAW